MNELWNAIQGAVGEDMALIGLVVLVLIAWAAWMTWSESQRQR